MPAIPSQQEASERDEEVTILLLSSSATRHLRHDVPRKAVRALGVERVDHLADVGIHVWCVFVEGRRVRRWWLVARTSDITIYP